MTCYRTYTTFFLHV